MTCRCQCGMLWLNQSDVYSGMAGKISRWLAGIALSRKLASIASLETLPQTSFRCLAPAAEDHGLTLRGVYPFRHPSIQMTTDNLR